MSADTPGLEEKSQITVRIVDLKWMVKLMNKQRLIDANTLVGTDGLFSTRGCAGSCNNCHLWSEEGCRVILEAPTVDAVEVVHGHWIEKPTGRYGKWQSWCSACGTHSGIGGIESNRHKPYCPNCGAKMDEMIL